MKQIITIEIEETEEKKYDYTTLIMLALYERAKEVMTSFTKETEENHRKIAMECEKLIDAVAKAKVKRC